MTSKMIALTLTLAALIATPASAGIGTSPGTGPAGAEMDHGRGPR